MTDNEIEGALREYRPAAPDASLRARILTAGDRRRDRWLWIAAAAMAVAAIGIHVLASRTIDSAGQAPDRAVTDARTMENSGWIIAVTGDDAQARKALFEALDAAKAQTHAEQRDRVVEATWIH